MKLVSICLIIFILVSCGNSKDKKETIKLKEEQSITLSKTSLIVLGTVQDAGSPHIACKKECCRELFKHPDKRRKVVSLGLIDPESGKKYIIDATPDFTSQMKMLKEFDLSDAKESPDGIFLTHAHIGHYTGLMYLGKEAMNADEIQVFAMPKMKTFLENNGPWSQLVSNQNMVISEIEKEIEVELSANLSLIPFTVPHRDEYSETVGYKIIGPHKKVLFIPDIDKWDRWNKNIIEEISKVDYAFLDATFYDAEEVNNRDISQIPHPFIIESISLFEEMTKTEKSKIYFIHFNHSNPVLNSASMQTKEILKRGFNIARFADVFEL